MAGRQQTLCAILSYLDSHSKTGQLDHQRTQDLQVAIQSLEKVFGVTASDWSHVTPETAQKQLSEIVRAHNFQAAESDSCSTPSPEPSEDDKQEVKDLKIKGNDFMKAEKYPEAVQCYTQAIEKNGTNALYYCNRAAAYSKLKEHQKAIDDCMTALSIDPNYSKAFGRIGIAYTALGKYESALECYRKAVELDPDNQNNHRNLELAEQKVRETQQAARAKDKGQDTPWSGSFLTNPYYVTKILECLKDLKMQEIFVDAMTGNALTRLCSFLKMATIVIEHINKSSQPMAQRNPELLQQLLSRRDWPSLVPAIATGSPKDGSTATASQSSDTTPTTTTK